MKTLLILGGSQQIGRRLIERIFDEEINEYSISTFNRGLTNPDFFKNKRVKKIIGDRNTDDIKKVFNQDWDLVLDCSCYEPIPFKKLLEGLKGRVGRYVFISTISVYDYKKNIGKEELISENFGLLSFTEEQIRAEGYRNYGEKKVASEKYLLESGLDAIVLRPHFIYGKYDWQNLDYYWIDRIQRFKDLLIPGGKDLIQRTYIEDLVSILLDSFLMEKHQRVYNVVTHDPITIN
ncbi:MAG: 2'-hydroxyisoflavone reductase, partial [Nonlabens sp.]